MLVVPRQLCQKNWSKLKKMGSLWKGKHTGRPRKTSEDRKLRAICLKIENAPTKDIKKQMNRNVCDQTVRNQLKEIRFPSRKSKEKKTRLQRAEEKQPWTVDGWMEVTFRDESPIFSLVQAQWWMTSLIIWGWCQVKDQGRWQPSPLQ